MQQRPQKRTDDDSSTTFGALRRRRKRFTKVLCKGICNGVVAARLTRGLGHPNILNDSATLGAVVDFVYAQDDKL
ncbi:hypothetical protein C3L29_016375 [Pseudomonas sp. MWU12-2534b]|nr:hypothetical protein C3L29_016375 [Pseudomonas sp. MWU12-2534b]